jgi:geranyl-CoA carboxylase alpha subunit
MDIDGERITALFHATSPATLAFSIGAQSYKVTNQNAVIASADDAAGAGAVIAPMHGALLEIFVKQGESVTKGQRLAILEAMKMQYEILAEIDGRVAAVNAEAGTQVAADTVMIEIEGAE